MSGTIRDMRVSSERGWALLTALMALALGTALLLPWQEAARAELRAAQRAHERCRARWALDATLEGARLALDADPTPAFDSASDPWNEVFAEPVILGGVEIRGILTAEDRLWDANNAASHADTRMRVPADIWRDIFALGGYPEGRLTAAALADWIDPDSDGSSDAFFYLNREPGYPVKNAPLDSMTELLLIRGFEPLWLTGGTDDATGTTWPPLGASVTVLPRLHATGITPVNVNLASRDMVRALVGLDRLRVGDRILRRRDAAPFRSLAEVEAVAGADDWPRLQALVAVRSSWFRLDATAAAGESTVGMSARLFRPAGARTVCRQFRWGT